MEENLSQEQFIPAGFELADNGLFRTRSSGQPAVRITTCPVVVIGLLRDSNSSTWTVGIEFLDPDENRQELLIPYATITSPRDLVQTCSKAGLMILSNRDKDFSDYLALCATAPDLPRYLLTKKLGFNVLPDAVVSDRLVFVRPDETLVPTGLDEVPLPSESMVFQPQLDNSTLKAYTSSGTFEESYELLQRVADDPVAIFFLSASLAAPFLELARVDNFILHLFGKSSIGKTSRLQLAAMLWGKPLDPQTAGNDVTLIERWNSTGNAMEILAATHNGMLLCIDELGGNIDDTISIYNPTSGRGKNRMTRDGGMQASYSWTLPIFSTGELSIWERIQASTGKSPKTGEVIRALDIPLDSITAYETWSTEQTSLHIQDLKSRMSETYGTIGPAFTQEIINLYGTSSSLKEDLAPAIDEHHAILVEKAKAAGCELQSPHLRALRRFAFIRVIGGQAATGFLPFDASKIEEAVDMVTLAWLKSLPALDDKEQNIDQFRDWIVSNLGQMAVYGEEGTYIPSVTRGIRYQGRILLTKEHFTNVCQSIGTSPATFAKSLKKMEALECEPQKLTKRLALGEWGLKNVPFYVIVLDKLLTEAEQDEVAAAPPTPDVDPYPTPRGCAPQPRRKTRPAPDDLETLHSL